MGDKHICFARFARSASPPFASLRSAYTILTYCPRTALTLSKLGIWNPSKVKLCKSSKGAHNPPQAVRPCYFCAFAGAACLIWFRYASPFIKVSCKPITASAAPLCRRPSASVDFFLFACGGHGLPCVVRLSHIDYFFIRSAALHY